MIRQELDTDRVERYIAAPPEALYDVIADVTRTPESSLEAGVVRLGRGPAYRADGRRALPCLEQGPGSAGLAQLARRHRRRPRPGVRVLSHAAHPGTLVWRYVFTP